MKARSVKVVLRLFALWVVYMLVAYVYSVYNATDISLKDTKQSAAAWRFEYVDSVTLNSSSDSIAFLTERIKESAYEIERLVDENKVLRAYENMVLFPVSFPLRMLILFILLAIVAYIASRNKRLLHERIKSKYEAKQRKAELQNSVLLLSKRNEDIDSLLEQLVVLEKNPNEAAVKSLILNLQHNRSVENNWLGYLNTFESVNPTFFSKLEAIGVDLTPSEKRLCAFISQDLTINQIATIVNVNTSSVEKARYRLRKKFGLLKHQNLNEYIKGLI